MLGPEASPCHLLSFNWLKRVPRQWLQFVLGFGVRRSHVEDVRVVLKEVLNIFHELVVLRLFVINLILFLETFKTFKA